MKPFCYSDAISRIYKQREREKRMGPRGEKENYLCLLILVKHFSFARPDKTQLCSKSMHNPACLSNTPPLLTTLPALYFGLLHPLTTKASRQHFVATELKLVSSPSGTQREWQLTFLFPGDSDLISAAPRPVPAAQRQQPLCRGWGARGEGGFRIFGVWGVLHGQATWIISGQLA